MIILSAISLYLTSLWNRGFILPSDLRTFALAALILALVLYVIVPLSKIILLPLNILSLGLISFLVFIILLHLGNVTFHFFDVRSWTFPGLSILFVTIPSLKISYVLNLVLSSVSISSIINVLELLL